MSRAAASRTEWSCSSEVLETARHGETAPPRVPLPSTCSRSRRRVAGPGSRRRPRGLRHRGGCGPPSRRAAAGARGCPGRAGECLARGARAPARSTAAPRPSSRGGRATGGRVARRRGARTSSGRSSAGGYAGCSRPRNGRAGSCPPPRPRAGGGRRAFRDPADLRAGFGVSTSTCSPTSGCRRRAARWSASPSGIGARIGR